MKEIAAQLQKVWKQMKPLQRIVLVAVTLLIAVMLGYLITHSTAKQYQAPSSEEELVPEAGHKGFELFDTNTWIKGDKELQVLEMRALKGQLERDLTEFDQIKSASVILDIPPARTFGSSTHKTKASVILALNPGTQLSTSQLKAITYHLAGAVHGLEPNMIAISDTTGKLYKVLDPEGSEELLTNASVAFEEHLDQKIRALLNPILGAEHYVCTVQALIEKGKRQPSSLSIAVAIDQEHEALAAEIENQLRVVASGYEVPFVLAVDPFPFEKKRGLWTETKEKGGYGGFILTLLVVLLAIGSLYPFFRKYSKKKQEENLFRVMTRIDINKLADSIAGEDPETIALMLSYLEPAKAQQLITSLPQEVQEEIVKNLSEIEYESN
ncbi:MAG: hypothetical protein JJU12_07615 [Chlamydiales bacterium]|nr:hypothetical protein [Chlamydiales bacterium]